MTRLLQVSDLHLEFNADFRLRNTEKADWLNLGGDICVAEYFTRSKASPKRELAERWLEFFEVVSREFETVTYILGNHESYYGNLHDTANILKETLQRFPNIRILDNQWTTINGFQVFGATLWTDVDKRNPLALNAVQQGMNDFKLIQYRGYRKLLPLESALLHSKTLEEFSRTYIFGTPCIFLSHHAPSYRSIHETYRTGRYSHLNPAYYSDLDNFILNHQDLVLWTHGHVHSNFDYYIGNTRVVCNPHGYGNENKDEFSSRLIIEL